MLLLCVLFTILLFCTSILLFIVVFDGAPLFKSFIILVLFMLFAYLLKGYTQAYLNNKKKKEMIKQEYETPEEGVERVVKDLIKNTRYYSERNLKSEQLLELVTLNKNRLIILDEWIACHDATYLRKSYNYINIRLDNINDNSDESRKEKNALNVLKNQIEDRLQINDTKVSAFY